MSKEAFTPGPWRAELYSPADGFEEKRDVFTSGGVVCEMIDAPDAYLIAASPDMYAAGSLMFQSNLLDGEECVTIPRKAYDAMRSALKKARGEA